VNEVSEHTTAEAISVIQSLVSQSPNIQKILVFEGVFEKLLTIITMEGGIEGSVTAQEALKCVDGLLRYNPSNQVRCLFVQWHDVNRA
jgi:intracellular protein transport protein USO1